MLVNVVNLFYSFSLPALFWFLSVNCELKLYKFQLHKYDLLEGNWHIGKVDCTSQILPCKIPSATRDLMTDSFEIFTHTSTERKIQKKHRGIKENIFFLYQLSMTQYRRVNKWADQVWQSAHENGQKEYLLIIDPDGMSCQEIAL